jgi:hypothetical protein
MPSLYQISENIKELETLLEQMDEGDATIETVKEYLDNIKEVDLAEKVENIVKFVRNLRAQSDMYKAEKQRLEKLERSAKKKADGLEDYLSVMLQSLGYNHQNKRKIQTAIGNIGFKKNPPKLEIVNIDKIPVEWDKPVKREVRNSDLLKYAKELVSEKGIDLKKEDAVLLEELGIKIVNDNSSLQIK